MPIARQKVPHKMDSLPEFQTAIIGLEDGTLTISKNMRLPKVEDDMILVKAKFVGLNPVDTKMVGRLVVPGAIVGTDFAGHVVAIGSNARMLTRELLFTTSKCFSCSTVIGLLTRHLTQNAPVCKLAIV